MKRIHEPNTICLKVMLIDNHSYKLIINNFGMNKKKGSKNCPF